MEKLYLLSLVQILIWMWYKYKIRIQKWSTHDDSGLKLSYPSPLFKITTYFQNYVPESSKVENTPTLWPKISLQDIYSRKICIHIHQKTCTRILIAARNKCISEQLHSTVRDESYKRNAERSQTQGSIAVWFHFLKSSKNGVGCRCREGEWWASGCWWYSVSYPSCLDIYY